MPLYRKKPVIINAVQNDGVWKTIVDWLSEIEKKGIQISRKVGVTRNMNGSLIVRTRDGSIHAEIDDWVICDEKGEFYKCEPDIFEATYEPV